ncbi:MAG: hypothetical protein KIT69_00465 [Propionibacteriaceae bacterium]|nr:hypothetical protein [Propionibacteriaceae bacterium]
MSTRIGTSLPLERSERVWFQPVQPWHHHVHDHRVRAEGESLASASTPSLAVVTRSPSSAGSAPVSCARPDRLSANEDVHGPSLPRRGPQR